MGRACFIGKEVNYKTLERVLIESAKKVDLKAKVNHRFDIKHKFNLFRKTQETYNYTMVNLKKGLFPFMSVYVPNKNSSNWFSVWNGFPYGIASKEEVEKYSEVVLKNLR